MIDGTIKTKNIDWKSYHLKKGSISRRFIENKGKFLSLESRFIRFRHEVIISTVYASQCPAPTATQLHGKLTLQSELLPQLMTAQLIDAGVVKEGVFCLFQPQSTMLPLVVM